MAQPYPISRETREEAIFLGDGGSSYGPFELKIFDSADVLIYTKATGDTVWTEQAVTITKASDEPFDEFSIAFAGNIPNTTKIKVISARVHERTAGLMQGVQLNPDALEKELTKVGTILQELARDRDRSIKMDFDAGTGLTVSSAVQDGELLMKQGNQLVPGPSADTIEAVQGNAQAALDAKIAAEAAAAAVALGLDGRVRYDAEQSKTSEERAQARTNIGAASVSDPRLVKADFFPTFSDADAGGHFGIDTDGSFYINRIMERAIISGVPGYRFTTAEIDDMLDLAATVDVTAKVKQVVGRMDELGGYCLKFPGVGVKLSEKITHTSKLSVESQDHGFITWAGASDKANTGWKPNGDLSGTRPGYGHCCLPQLIGANDISGHVGSWSSNSYSLAAYQGIGLDIDGWTWGKFKVHQAKGWGAAIRIGGNSRGSFNLDIDAGTIDLCKYGLLFQPVDQVSPYVARPAAQSRAKLDNVFAYWPIFFDVTNGTVFEWAIDALGLICVERATSGAETSCIYVAGAATQGKMTNVRVEGKMVNQHDPNDSPSSTPTTYLGPIISGDQTGPGSVVGYANGARNRFLVDLNDRVPSTVPLFKDKGSNVIQVLAPTESPTSPLTSIALSATTGLANFNGGKPLFHKKNRLSVTLAADLAAGGVTDFYMYHEATRADLNVPTLRAMQVDNFNGLEIHMIPSGTTEAYKQTVRIRNYTNATIASGVALNFHVVVI